MFVRKSKEPNQEMSNVKVQIGYQGTLDGNLHIPASSTGFTYPKYIFCVCIYNSTVP